MDDDAIREILNPTFSVLQTPDYCYRFLLGTHSQAQEKHDSENKNLYEHKDKR